MAKVFVSYSHEDQEWMERVVKHLRVLSPAAWEVWDDRKIAAGDDWLPAIKTALAGCDVALLLISADFLTSPFILGKEVPELLRRREQEGVRIIPVIVRACAWQRVSWLSPLQARPTGGVALGGMQSGIDEALAALVHEIADLLLPTGTQPTPVPTAPLTPQIDLQHLPDGAPEFLGRERELGLLDQAWSSLAQPIGMVELVASGGVGKTSLVKRWLERMRADGWRGARRVYGWSFYSQGSSEQRQASEDGFLAAALEWFGVNHNPASSAADKGKLLAKAVTQERTLLLLDGLEPLQYPPGPMGGRLKAPGLEALLTQLASAGHPGLCVITTRERIGDLQEFERNEERPEGALLRQPLNNLNPRDSARLLHKLGVQRAGQATIPPEDEELIAAGKQLHGHALTLALLGRYLKLVYGGDIRQWDKVDLEEANLEASGGHAFKVMAAYERWFEREGEAGARPLAALRLLGLFDRPAGPAQLAALRAAPPIPGLTEPLVGLSQAQWNLTLGRLKECGLVEQTDPEAPLDAHPLVREYLAGQLREKQPEAWREGHRRLYEQLKGSAPHRPEDLAGLQPLYQAVAHGCWAGLYQEACDEVYDDRILRGTGDDGFFSTKKLGAIGDDLGAVACFFDPPWERPVAALAEGDRAWLLSEAAVRLRALGRLGEARAPMRVGAEMAVQQENWKSAAISYSNLSQLELTLGAVAAAVREAERALEHAERSGDMFERMAERATLADALHQQGAQAAAQQHFAQAEALQAEHQPNYPRLYSLWGFRYCDLLLRPAEQGAWQRGPAEREAGLRACAEVEARGELMFKWRVPGDSLLTIALDHLTLARCALYRALLTGQAPDPHGVDHLTQAVDGLRAAGQQDDLPRGLLTRAHLHHTLGDLPAAVADLQEAERISRRGGMRLHLADIHLHRARLFQDRHQLALARQLIDDCGYGRRLPELEDAEAAVKSWPAPVIQTTAAPKVTETRPMAPSTKRFQVALSFAGEQRNFVQAVAEQLSARLGKNRVLYDAYYEAEFARPDLDTYLQRLYHDDSDLVVVFLCEHYERKQWCGLEWRAVRDLIKKRRSADIMPMRFDTTEIPGLFSTDGYVWLGGKTPEAVAALILERLGLTPAAAPKAPPAVLAPSASPITKPLSKAAAIWAEKLEFLRAQEAICSDPAQLFSLKKQIEAAEAKLRALS